MRKILTVTRPFGDYARGDRIEGSAVQGVQASHPGHVVASMIDEPQAEAVKPESKPEDPPAPKASK